MSRVQVTPKGLADALRRMPTQIQKATKDAMVEGGLMLEGALVQKEIAASDPKPVDQAQYKGGWTHHETDDGIEVGNTTKHSLFVERGRGPGPVPLKPILEWVIRKGFARSFVKALAKIRGRRATLGEQTAAEMNAARAIQQKIQREGTPPRWVLRRAIEALRPKMPGILKRALKTVKP